MPKRRHDALNPGIHFGSGDSSPRGRLRPRSRQASAARRAGAVAGRGRRLTRARRTGSATRRAMDAGSPDWVGHPPAMDAGGVEDAGKAGAGGRRRPCGRNCPPPTEGSRGRPSMRAATRRRSTAGVETVPVRPPVAGEIVIAEVLVNPTGTDAGREWIEIVNRAAEPLDLADLRVADLAAEVPAPAGIIPPGARVVLGQSVDAGTNGGAPVTAAYGTRIALNNDGEEIAICIGTCASGVVIDRLSWKTLGAGYDGHALVVDHDAGLTVRSDGAVRHRRRLRHPRRAQQQLHRARRRFLRQTAGGAARAAHVDSVTQIPEPRPPRPRSRRCCRRRARGPTRSCRGSWRTSRRRGSSFTPRRRRRCWS